MKRLAIILGVLVLVGLGVWVFVMQNDSPQSDSSSTSPDQQNVQPKEADSEATPVTTITYTNSGFEPSVITIKTGETVEVKNTSAHPLQFASDPHPVHTDNSELNLGSVRPGESMNLTLDTKGSWGFHNHLNESDAGKVNVE